MRLLNIILCAGAVNAYTVTNVKGFMVKNIDPIVQPGNYTSHMHSFFGSDAVTINTTTSNELQAGCTTAENPNDFSSYWVPTLYVRNGTNTTKVPIFRFSAYYINIDWAEIAIPQDFKVVVGNASATSQIDAVHRSGLQWFCNHGGQGVEEDKEAGEFPTVTCPAHLQALLLFHDCVNEETLESTYSGVHHWTKTFKSKNRCPIGMKRIPQLRFSIRYDLRKVLPNGWNGPAPLELSCGSSYCLHGDFINGWLPEAAENMLLAKDKRKFKSVEGPNTDSKINSRCSGPATDVDPANGTSNYEESKKILQAQV